MILVFPIFWLTFWLSAFVHFELLENLSLLIIYTHMHASQFSSFFSFFYLFFCYRIFRIFSSILIMYLSCFSLSTLCSAPLSLFVINLCYASSTYTTKEYLVIMLNFFDLLHSVTNCFISRSTCMHNFPSPPSSQVLPSDGIICDGNTRAFLTLNVIVVPRIQV